jgi:hypothetical protein
MTEKTLFQKVSSYVTLYSQSQRFSDLLLGEVDRSCNRGAATAFKRLIKDHVIRCALISACLNSVLSEGRRMS